VDSLTQLELTRALIDIDSTTGSEGDAGRLIASTLRLLGYDVVEQPVSHDRFNVLATTTHAPAVVFSTHFDCVPPFFPSRTEGGRLYGRGACDAKGILMAQVAAAERLRAAGESRIGMLFVVGEERGSDGAKLANTVAAGSRFLINGEPTGNRLGVATRGVYRVRLTATGRAAHTSQPDLGISAIDKLLDALIALRGVDWPAEQVLGRTFYTVGLISGGVAPNVVSPSAEAELMFRTVGDHEILRSLIMSAVGDLVSLEDVLVVPPVTLKTMPGFESSVFSFTTDSPFLDAWGAPLLVGPGHVTVAHTSEEHIELSELAEAVDLYVTLARNLLSQIG
jgi:acetylornithine deacetylase